MTEPLLEQMEPPTPVLMLKSSELTGGPTVKKKLGLSAKIKKTCQGNLGSQENVSRRVLGRQVTVTWVYPEQPEKNRCHKWKEPMKKAICLVCNMQCSITVNRKIPSIPFCKDCKKTHFRRCRRSHNRKKKLACLFDGNCDVDYRIKSKCPYCHHTKFEAALQEFEKIFKTDRPFDPFSQEIMRKAQTVRNSLTENNVFNKEIPWSYSRDAKLVEEALRNCPRVKLMRLDESLPSATVYKDVDVVKEEPLDVIEGEPEKEGSVYIIKEEPNVDISEDSIITDDNSTKTQSAYYSQKNRKIDFEQLLKTEPKYDNKGSSIVWSCI